ncbi:MAG: FAD-dependent oxidoreductase [Asgard group archaeon]|nr:FAD-dependent oxidoreductase [Asgard group archaeon]
MSQKIVVIGNGPAGMSVASAARLHDRKAEITVIDSKTYDTYHPCAMPFVIGGYLPSIDSIVEDLNFSRMKINLIGNSLVEEVKTKEQKVLVKNLITKEKQTYDYDKIVFCTGSHVFIPPIKGKDLANVYSLKFAEDAKAIKDAIHANNVNDVVIVGGSAIGIEVASEIAHLGKNVTIVEMQPQLMPFKVSKRFAKKIYESLAETGVSIKTNMLVKEIIGEKQATQVKYGNDEKEEVIDAQVVVLATGVRPNIELAKKAGLEIHDRLKAIMVNDKMETNIENIFAAGDCVTVKHQITGERCLALYAGPAVRQGRVAGINAAGGSATYPGTINSFIVSSRTFFVGGAGINDEQADNHNIEVEKAMISADLQPHYMPNSKEITLKLIADSDDGKILGIEAVGPRKVDVNVNYTAFALQTGLTVYDLMDIDFCYAPAVSETIYPIVKAASAIIRKIERKKARAKRKK